MFINEDSMVNHDLRMIIAIAMWYKFHKKWAGTKNLSLAARLSLGWKERTRPVAFRPHLTAGLAISC